MVLSINIVVLPLLNKIQLWRGNTNIFCVLQEPYEFNLMFLLSIGVTAFLLLCTLSIDFHHLFFIIKLLLNCFMAKFLITAHLESLAVCAMLLHWLIIDLNLILELSNVFSWAIPLLLKVTNCLIYILKEFLY